MAETTYTRKTLRRAIASELQMPFFRKYSAGEGSIGSGSTALKIKDTTLTQREGYWSGHWFYGVAQGNVSLIRAFSATDQSFQLEVPHPYNPTVGEAYEIHTIWNALDIHFALNQAMSDACRIFPETVVDQTLVFCEDKMEYDLTGLAKKPFILLRAYAEKPSVLIRGTATGGSTGYILAQAGQSLTDVDSNWLVSIYSGTGANQVRSVSTVAGLQVNVSSPWSFYPDATSKYAMWNPNKQRYDWNRLDIFYTDSDEFPDRMNVRTRLPYYYGMRLRLEYLYANESLATDVATTIIPKKFLVAKACSILHGQKLNDTKVDRDLHFQEYTRYQQMADGFILANAPRTPAITIPVSESPLYMDNENPLGWPGAGGEPY